MSKKKEKWKLNFDDVHQYGGAGNSSGRRKASQSRSLDLTSKEWNLLHTPTGIEVKGEVTVGHYSRKEMHKLEDQLLKNLFIELERKVAKHLRVPGYA